MAGTRPQRHSQTLHPLTTNDRSHRGITGRAGRHRGRPRSWRTAQRLIGGTALQLVAGVIATAAVEELCDRDVGEPKGIIELNGRSANHRPK
jgi:hypothetical protein